jgi:hypothetical protein
VRVPIRGPTGWVRQGIHKTHRASGRESKLPVPYGTGGPCSCSKHWSLLDHDHFMSTDVKLGSSYVALAEGNMSLLGRATAASMSVTAPGVYAILHKIVSLSQTAFLFPEATVGLRSQAFFFARATSQAQA